jgi:hypothetical protein
MHQHRSSFLIFTLVSTGLLLFSCAPASESQPEAPTQPVPSLSPSETPSPTVEPTQTATATPEPTATQTPTISPSPTPNMVLPGSFAVGGCGSAAMSQGDRLDFCVTGVTVDGNRHMIFDVTWTLSDIPGGYEVTKRSDQGNTNMYLLDNLGNRYNHVGGGGAAYSSVTVADGVPVSGWFDFGQPPIGAFVFEFHDDDNGIVIGGISLYGGGPAQLTITYKDFPLDQYPLILKYQEEIWQQAITNDGIILLSDKAMPLCTVRALSESQPKGEYKNTAAVGAITYEIYGYFDETLGLYVREYIYVSGLEGADPTIKPFFFVTIPAESSLACILDVSDLLSGLVPKNP